MIEDKSIEELEGFYPRNLSADSYVVRTSLNALKKPISQLSNEELRLLIGQRIGLKYLIPMALAVVNDKPLVEVTFFKGDLLLQLLRLSENDWRDNKDEFRRFQEIVKDNLKLIRSCEEIPNKLIEKALNQ